MANTTSTMRSLNESIADKAREVAGNVAEKIKETASLAAQKAGDTASTVGHKAEERTAAVGGGMRSLAGTILENAPQSGTIGTMSSNVASSLESGGRYLQEHGLRGMGEDVTNLIRRNPLPAVLLGIGLGFMIARLTQRD